MEYPLKTKKHLILRIQLSPMGAFLSQTMRTLKKVFIYKKISFYAHHVSQLSSQEVPTSSNDCKN